MQIIITFADGGTYTDRARDMQNGLPRAQEWAGQANVTQVQIKHQQQILWDSLAG